MATAQGCRGAAGADGWTADEIRYLPLDAFNLVANFFERCVAEGELPSQFFEARMVCIPKAAKITDYQIHVDQCRPITILSVFWRLWISTICKSPEMKNWIDAVIHPSINGLGGGDMYTTITRIFDQFDQDGYILGLDYCKAFDCLDPLVTKELLRRYGWPEPFISLCTRVWGGQKRFLSWGHHTHPHPLPSASQPQGDPLGPLIMSLWVLSGVLSVQSEGSSVSTYLDDRCVTAVSPAILRQSLSRWEAWSAGVGLLESVAKTVAVGRRAAERSLLQSEFQPSMVSCWIRVLGACSYSSPRGLTPVESERVSAALQCLSLLGGVGFNLSHFLTNCRLFALSKVGVGWVARAPPLYASQRLFTAVWKNSRRVRFSNPWLRAMLLGGMSIWILLGSPGWLGVSSVALFGIAPVGLCVRARWRPVFMAGSSIGGGVLFGNGSGNTTSLLLLWISSPLGFCPPFFLAWRVWPSIIFVKDGEPGVFRSGPIQAGTKCNNSKKLPALSFAT